jgi:hypothetical protein
LYVDMLLHSFAIAPVPLPIMMQCTGGRLLSALGQISYGNPSLLLLIPALEFNPSGIVSRFPSGSGNAHHDKVQGVLKDIAVLIVQQQKLSA